VAGDKSISHRLLFFHYLDLVKRGQATPEAFEKRTQAIRGLNDGGAVAASFRAIRALLAEPHRAVVLDCERSATTARLLMGALAGQERRVLIQGAGQLCDRDMTDIVTPIQRTGCYIEHVNGAGLIPLIIHGSPGILFNPTPKPIHSAQVMTALQMLSWLLDRSFNLEPTPGLRDHTEIMLRALATGDAADVLTRDVPGDPSAAAFLIVAALLLPGSELSVTNLCLNPTRTGYLTVLQRMGADITVEVQAGDGVTSELTGTVTVRAGAQLRAVDTTADAYPTLVDEIPVLALLATQAVGTSRFAGLEGLRNKESNRLEGLAGKLSDWGADVRVEGDDLVINGPAELTLPQFIEYNADHRMQMLFHVARLVSTGVLPEQTPGDYTADSYPGFFQALRLLYLSDD
jgi:3-phosphoshikimate 1-carboxyvinyltransferase